MSYEFNNTTEFQAALARYTGFAEARVEVKEASKEVYVYVSSKVQPAPLADCNHPDLQPKAYYEESLLFVVGVKWRSPVTIYGRNPMGANASEALYNMCL